MMNFNNLKEIRKDNDLFQRELAPILDKTATAYAKYESGETIPSLETVYNFSKYFSYNIDYVLGLKEKRERAKYKDFDKELIANNLKALRESKNYSQGKLALKFDVERQTISAYETGKCIPSLEVLYKYIKLFEIDFHTLCTKKL